MVPGISLDFVFELHWEGQATDSSHYITGLDRPSTFRQAG